MRPLVVASMCVVCLSASTSPAIIAPQAVPHDAYVWQRLWKPSVADAARRSADIIHAWRVLTAEADATGRWTAFDVSWADIRATGRPVIAVVRIDGRLDEARMPVLLDRISIVSEGIAGVEIDYDCPTSKLGAYATFLAEMRRRLPASIALSITALPTWMSSNLLPSLGADVAEMILQVHAVDDPRRGLFDPDQAERWAREFGRRVGRPFRVAVPAYDVRVSWRPDGRRAGVEGEVPLLLGGASDNATLTAAPEAVLHLIRALEARPPEGWAGIVWFRLPTDIDRHAWSYDTWRAVVAGRLPRAHVSAELVPTDRPALWTVTLSNNGPVDAMVPRSLRLDPSCAAADGANGFRLKASEGSALALETSTGGRIRAHSRRVIGWARCTEPERHLDVVVQ
jgi:hypothetical protein